MQLVVLLVLVVYVYVLGGMLVSVARKGTSMYIKNYCISLQIWTKLFQCTLILH